MQKLMGIKVSVNIWREDEEPLDPDVFWDKFIDFIQSNNWLMAGNVDHIDMNVEPKEE